VGFSADVVTRVTRQAGAWRRLGGEARFALAAVGALAAWRNREVRVAVDDAELVECATNLIAVANGAYAGGGMKFAPSARVDDGRLEVLAACGVSRGGVMRELARIHRGGHVANPKIIFTSGTRVRVETVETGATLAVEADGDMRGYTPAEFRVMPGALRLVF
jgi:diacylglycerol kinase (ATP)